MRRTAKRNGEEMGAADESTSAEPLPMESESSTQIPAREPADGDFFFDRIAAITDAEWESRFVAYIYQTAPKISLPGDKHYIAKLNSRFDESSVLANYGSGQYHVRLNDKTLRKTVATHLFSVYDVNKPPAIDLALIVDCPENAPFLKWKKSDATTAGSENGASAVVAEIARDAMRKPKTDVTEGMLLGMAEGRDKLAEKLATMEAPAHDGLASCSPLPTPPRDGLGLWSPLPAPPPAVAMAQALHFDQQQPVPPPAGSWLPPYAGDVLSPPEWQGVRRKRLAKRRAARLQREGVSPTRPAAQQRQAASVTALGTTELKQVAGVRPSAKQKPRGKQKRITWTTKSEPLYRTLWAHRYPEPLTAADWLELYAYIPKKEKKLRKGESVDQQTIRLEKVHDLLQGRLKTRLRRERRARKMTPTEMAAEILRSKKAAEILRSRKAQRSERAAEIRRITAPV